LRLTFGGLPKCRKQKLRPERNCPAAFWQTACSMLFSLCCGAFVFINNLKIFNKMKKFLIFFHRGEYDFGSVFKTFALNEVDARNIFFQYWGMYQIDYLIEEA